MKSHQRTVGKTDIWLTPPEILSALGVFDLDPCAAPQVRLKCASRNFALPGNDGLRRKWSFRGMKKPRVWCNPPFNRYQRPRWMKAMAEHGNGILLIPAATETKAFYDWVWGRAHAICFLRGRPHFLHASGERAKANCGCSIALVAYGNSNAKTLAKANLGRTIWLQ